MCVSGGTAGVGQSVTVADSHGHAGYHRREKAPRGLLSHKLTLRFSDRICQTGEQKRRESWTVLEMSGRVLNGKMLQLPAPQRAGRTIHFLSRYVGDSKD